MDRVTRKISMIDLDAKPKIAALTSDSVSSQNSNDIGSLWAHYKSRIWGSPEKWVPNCLLQKKNAPSTKRKKKIYKYDA